MREQLCYIGLGSNIGDKKKYLENARCSIAKIPKTKITKMSRIYKTKPIGGVKQDFFLNQVIAVKTKLRPEVLLRECQRIEKENGRKRYERWGPRSLDIDILIYDELVQNDGDLVLPHPEIKSRAFVLVPLNEIDPYIKIDRITVKECLANLPSKCKKDIQIWDG